MRLQCFLRQHHYVVAEPVLAAVVAELVLAVVVLAAVVVELAAAVAVELAAAVVAELAAAVGLVLVAVVLQQRPQPPLPIAADDAGSAGAGGATVTIVVRTSLSAPATTPHPPLLPKHRDGAPTWLHSTIHFPHWPLLADDDIHTQEYTYTPPVRMYVRYARTHSHTHRNRERVRVL